MQEKKLYKNVREGKISGVCAGFADFFGIDVTIIRLIWVCAAVFYGTGLLAYIIAAIVLPVEPSNQGNNRSTRDYGEGENYQEPQAKEEMRGDRYDKDR